MSELIQRVLKLRETAGEKPEEPNAAFLDRLRLPIDVLRLAEATFIEDQRKFEARRNFCVSMCAAFEVQWRQVLRVAVDNFCFNEEQTRKLKKREFSLSDIFGILGHEVSLGEVVVSGTTLNDPDKIHNFCQEVFEFDLFGNLEKKGVFIMLRSDSTESKHKSIDASEALVARGLIKECFSGRHRFVHDTGLGWCPTAEDIDNYFQAMMKFNILAESQIRLELFPEGSKVQVGGKERTGYEFGFTVMPQTMSMVIGDFEWETEPECGD